MLFYLIPENYRFQKNLFQLSTKSMNWLSAIKLFFPKLINSVSDSCTLSLCKKRLVFLFLLWKPFFMLGEINFYAHNAYVSIFLIFKFHREYEK